MKKGKGFTLIELMVVIVVVGILAAMFMLSSTEAVATAKANNIITGLNAFRQATLSWYSDNRSRVRILGATLQCVIYYGDDNEKCNNLEGFIQYKKANAAEILEYLDKNSSVKLASSGSGGAVEEGQYCFGVASYGSHKDNFWCIGYKFPDSDTKVREKVAYRASSLKLFGGERDRESWPHPKPSTTFTKDNKIVWMHIMTHGE